MLLFRMEDFHLLPQGETNGWPALSTILSFKERVMSRVSKKAEAKAALGAAIGKKAWATRRAKSNGQKTNPKPPEAAQVIEALVEGRRNRNRLFDRYVEAKVAEGYDESRIRAAIKAHVTRQTA